MTQISPWYPANNGSGKRIWFVYRDHPDVRERYRFSKNDRLIRYASAKAAQRAADRLNAEQATYRCPVCGATYPAPFICYNADVAPHRATQTVRVAP